MSAPSSPHESDEIARLRADFAAQLAAQAAQIAALQANQRHAPAPRPRPHPLRRVLPLLLAILLVALVPLATFAATPFTDLDPAQNGPSGHNPNIELLYNAGVTKGCDPTHYCPKDFVTREQMATFLARTAGLGDNPPVAYALSASQLGGVGAANYVRTTDNRLPLAFGTVNSTGSPFSGTSNFSVNRESTGKYIITILGQLYDYRTFATMATLIDSLGGETSTGSTLDGKLVVYIHNSAGALKDDPFQFVVYKP